MIYQITNTINGKSYVGFTADSKEERWRSHRARALKKGHKTYLHCAIRKYGIDVFVMETLEEGWDPKIGLSIREPYWISVLKPEYNHTRGGEGTLGHIATAVQNKANSQRNLGRKMSAESSKRKSEATKGVPHTPDHRRKLIEGIMKRTISCIVTDPTGKTTKITNIAKFCRENQLDQGGMCLVSQGKRSHHKGWKCEKVLS